MKKRVILGVILIIIAIGGTIAMNTAGIFKGTPYKSDNYGNQIKSFSVTFYNNTYTSKKEYEPTDYNSNPEPDVECGYYIKNGNSVEFLKNYNWNGKYKITPYQLVIGNIKYVNRVAICVQILFVAMGILGAILLIKSRKSKRLNLDENGEKNGTTKI